MEPNLSLPSSRPAVEAETAGRVLNLMVTDDSRRRLGDKRSTRIIPASASGAPSLAVTEAVGVTRQIVGKWRIGTYSPPDQLQLDLLREPHPVSEEGVLQSIANGAEALFLPHDPLLFQSLQCPLHTRSRDFESLAHACAHQTTPFLEYHGVERTLLLDGK